MSKLPAPEQTKWLERAKNEGLDSIALGKEISPTVEKPEEEPCTEHDFACEATWSWPSCH